MKKILVIGSGGAGKSTLGKKRSNSICAQPQQRVEERIRAWNIVVEDRCETPSSILVFGRRGQQSVILKMIRQPGDEWHCGEVLAAFNCNGDGKGIVRVYESTNGFD